MRHIQSTCLVIAFLLMSSQAYSWGGRGHNVICMAAVHLVQNPELKEFMKTRPHVMGHLCNIPDIYWKSLTPEDRKLGDPTHYINPEKLGLKISEVPTDYKKIEADYTGKPSKFDATKTLFSVPDEVGSSWWRADQFSRLATEYAKQAKEAKAPQDFKEEQNNDLPYNKAVYQMMVSMGLMGHFIGDMGQPFHNTSDHDGYAANHGGIHSYYEEAVVAAFGGDLEARIVKQAQSWKSQKFITQANVIENSRALCEISSSEIKDVLKADKVVKPSSVVIDKGMSIRKAAERKSPNETFKSFEPLIVRQMARSALLLAHSWDEAYKAGGQPELGKYRSYLYPFTPDFVKPDYQ